MLVAAALDALWEEFKQRCRHHFSQGWARWEVEDLIRGDGRALGVTVTPEQAEQLVREALPEIRL